MTVNPPTGLEQPQKYYGGAYLDEELKFKAEVQNAAAAGREINTEGVHPATIAAVHPSLLDSDGKAPNSGKDTLVEGDPTDSDLPGIDGDKQLDSRGVSDGTSIHGEDTRLKGGGNLPGSPTSASTLAAEEQSKDQAEKEAKDGYTDQPDDSDESAEPKENPDSKFFAKK